MERLPPLAVSLLMTISAIAGGGERAALDEVIALNGRIPGSRESVFAKAKVIAPADFGRVGAPSGGMAGLLRGLGPHPPGTDNHASRNK